MSKVERKWSSSHSGIKRIMGELQDLQKNPSPDYEAHPLDDNLFEWHFTVRGPPDTEFEGGVYHGRIILPPDYPYKAPDIMLLTPNGRFQTNEKICLSITSHHQETWTPAWEIRNILIALIGFMPTEAKGIGALEYPAETRKKLAKQSVSWQCDVCGCHNATALPNIETCDKHDTICTPVQQSSEEPTQQEPIEAPIIAPAPVVQATVPITQPVIRQPVATTIRPAVSIPESKSSSISETMLNASLLLVVAAIFFILYNKFTKPTM